MPTGLKSCKDNFKDDLIEDRKEDKVVERIIEDPKEEEDDDIIAFEAPVESEIREQDHTVLDPFVNDSFRKQSIASDSVK